MSSQFHQRLFFSPSIPMISRATRTASRCKETPGHLASQVWLMQHHQPWMAWAKREHFSRAEPIILTPRHMYVYINIYIYIINTWGINPANTLNQASNPTTTNQSWHSYTAPKHLEVQRIEATSVASRVDEIQVVSMHSTKHPLAPPNWPWDGPWPHKEEGLLPGQSWWRGFKGSVFLHCLMGEIGR